jgi:hypothetical protein
MNTSIFQDQFLFFTQAVTNTDLETLIVAESVHYCIGAEYDTLSLERHDKTKHSLTLEFQDAQDITLVDYDLWELKKTVKELIIPVSELYEVYKNNKPKPRAKQFLFIYWQFHHLKWQDFDSFDEAYEYYSNNVKGPIPGVDLLQPIVIYDLGGKVIRNEFLEYTWNKEPSEKAMNEAIDQYNKSLQ